MHNKGALLSSYAHCIHTNDAQFPTLPVSISTSHHPPSLKQIVMLWFFTQMINYQILKTNLKRDALKFVNPKFWFQHQRKKSE